MNRLMRIQSVTCFRSLGVRTLHQRSFNCILQHTRKMSTQNNIKFKSGNTSQGVSYTVVTTNLYEEETVDVVAYIIYKLYQIFASSIAIGTVLYIDDKKKQETEITDLILPLVCGFIAPLTTSVISGTYLGYNIYRDRKPTARQE